MNSGPYELFDYQRTGVEFIKQRKYALLADDPGLGKTAQALEAARQLGVTQLLIVCPGYLCTQWKKEALKFYGPARAAVHIMTPKVKHLPVEFDDSFVLICSYDMAWRRLHLLASRAYQFAILDESHNLKNSHAKRTDKILGRGSFLAKCDKILLMTGTPMLNKPLDIYTILRCFVPDALGVYIDVDRFRQRYCGFMERGAKNEAELKTRLQTFMLRREKSEVLQQLPEVVVSKIYLSGVFIPPEFANELAVIQRREVAIAKLPKTIEYVKGLLQTVDKVLVVGYHRDTIDTMKEALSEFNPECVYGGISVDERDKRIKAFIDGRQTSNRCRVIVANLSVIGIGVDGLQKVCDRIVFAELDWSPAIIQQAISRLQRMGQESGTVFADFLISEGTIEESIDTVLDAKTEMIDKIVSAHVPDGLSDDERQIMPHGFTQKQFDKLTPKAREAYESHGKTPRDNGVNVTRYYEQQEQLKKEQNKMARPKASTDGEPLAQSHIQKSAELLGQAIAAHVSALVHDMMNGGAGVTTPVKITGNVVPLEERMIPKLPEPVETVEVINHEDLKPLVTSLMATLKRAGADDKQALAHYRADFLGNFSSMKLIEMNQSELGKLRDALYSIKDDYIHGIEAHYNSAAAAEDSI